MGRGNVFPVYFADHVLTRGLLSVSPDEKHALDVAFQLMLKHLDELIDKGATKDLTERHSYTRVYHGKISK